MSDAELSEDLADCPVCGRLVNLTVVQAACPNCEHPLDEGEWSL